MLSLFLLLGHACFGGTLGIYLGGRQLLLRYDHVGDRHREQGVGGAGPAADRGRETVHQRLFPAEGQQHQPPPGLR